MIPLVFRLEKEKSQLRGELDDLQSQIEHAGKNRVN